jgi:dTMP kinase
VKTSPGKFIAIEGIDGSGKRTQLDLLRKALIARGQLVYATGFPEYDSWFGKMVGQFLNGDLGDLQSVDPHFSALLYAGNRFEAKPRLAAALQAGQIVLADRYVASNLAHQAARAPSEKRSEFQAWIEHLEYDIYGLPREDMVVYLRVPPAEAQQLVAKKSARAYTAAKQDIQEASLQHLEKAAEIYDLLARRASWKTVECFDSLRNAMCAPDAIAADVLAAVEPLLDSQVASQARKEGR